MHMPSTYDVPPSHLPLPYAPPSIPHQQRHSMTPHEARKEHRRHGSATSFYPAPAPAPAPPAQHALLGVGPGSRGRAPLARSRSSAHHHREEEFMHSHDPQQKQNLPPLAFPHASPAAYPASSAAGPRSRSPTEVELRGQVPRAWSPSAGVRQIEEPDHPYSPHRPQRAGLPIPPTGHDLMAMFPTPSPATNVQYQPVNDDAAPAPPPTSPSPASASTSTLASPSGSNNTGKGRDSVGPEIKLMRAMPVPIPGSTFFARQESAFFSQRFPDKRLPRTSSDTPPPPVRPISVHPQAHDPRERERDRIRRENADADVRMSQPPPPPRPKSTAPAALMHEINAPPHSHRHHHHRTHTHHDDHHHYRASPPPPLPPVHHSHAQMPHPPPGPPHHSRSHTREPPPVTYGGASASEWTGTGQGQDEDPMRRRAGKHTKRVFVQ